MHPRTFHAIDSKEKILKKLEEVAAELEADMESGGWTGKTVTLKYKLDTYQGMPNIVFLLLAAVSDLFLEYLLVPNHSTDGYLPRRKTFSQ